MRKVVGSIIGWFLSAAYPHTIKRFRSLCTDVDLIKRKRDKTGKFVK